MKVNSDNAYSGKIRGTISDKVKDRSNDPYFIRKADDAAEYVRKHGLPEEALKIQAERTKK